MLNLSLSLRKNPKSDMLLVATVGMLMFSSLFLSVNSQSRCNNPNQVSGYCVSIYECPSILEVINANQLTASQRLFIVNSKCTNGYGREPFVCCTRDKDYTSNVVSTTTTTTVRPSPRGTVAPAAPSNGKGNTLPQPPACGRNSLADKIYNGKNTALDDYQWMALLEYRSNNNGANVINCGGSLINQRYVVTAAHCLVGAILQEVGSLASIRLGEYDLSSEIDCVGSDCNEKVVQMGIEESLPHPEFNPSNANRRNDIGLVRLNADVTYTDFIRPVCLPLPGVSTRRSSIDTGELLIVAGWGRTLFARQSNIKQELAIPVNNHDECTRKFAAKNIDLISSQICLGGKFAEDSCDGDSGGPLMRQDSQKFWLLEGVVSFGNRCGLEGWPGVYTKVVDYIPWIQQNLKP